MNQKRFLTLLPLAFLTICVVILLIFAAMNTSRLLPTNNDCNNFIDDGLGIDFSYTCNLTLKLETKVSSNFDYNNEEGLERPFLTQYKIILSNSTSEITLDAVLAETSHEIKAFGDSSFEVLSNGLILETIKDNEYRVYEQVACQQQAHICGKLYISKISDKLMFRVSGTGELVREFVSGIVNL